MATARKLIHQPLGSQTVVGLTAVAIRELTDKLAFNSKCTFTVETQRRRIVMGLHLRCSTASG
jgi:hypothetical protein